MSQRRLFSKVSEWSISCLHVFQSGEAAERPDQRGERGRPESRGRRDLAMIRRRPPVPGGAVGGRGGRGGCDWWDTEALEVKGRGRANQASPRHAAFSQTTLISHRFMVKHRGSTARSKHGRRRWERFPQEPSVGFYWGGLLLRCDWLLKHRTRWMSDFQMMNQKNSWSLILLS